MPLNIIIIGSGLIGPRHAQSVVAHPSTTLLALIDPSPSASTTAAALQTAYFPSLRSLLASSLPKPSAAIICTPNHTHVPIATDLLAQGIHVLLEKPVSNTIASGKSLLRTLNEPGNARTKLLVGHHRRFNPFVQRTKQLLDARSLGRVLAVCGTWAAFKPDAYFAAEGSQWRRSRDAGGGVVPINLVHDVDVLHYLFGPIVRVHAEGTMTQRGRKPNEEAGEEGEAGEYPHDAEEGAAVTLRFASGVVGTFLVCDAAPSPFNFEAGTGENPLVPRCEDAAAAGFYRILGTQASLSVPDMTRWSYDGCEEKSWAVPLQSERFEVEPATPFDLQLAHFVDVVERDVAPSCSAEDGLRALVVCQGVKEALETGRTVDLDVDLLGDR
ncbi:quinate utilization oxidoreductase QutH [Aspergillus sp. HF37]|nr:quinate utilization oxidoreductase QutH [Aspergillus sp. HF37]